MKHRIVYLDAVKGKTVAKIESKHYYSVPGCGALLKIKNLKQNWGKDSRWGRYIRI